MQLQILIRRYLEKGVMLIGVLSLGIMGALASYAGGASIWRGSIRVMIRMAHKVYPFCYQDDYNKFISSVEIIIG